MATIAAPRLWAASVPVCQFVQTDLRIDDGVVQYQDIVVLINLIVCIYPTAIGIDSSFHPQTTALSIMVPQ
jgi:hypothetical protein